MTVINILHVSDLHISKYPFLKALNRRSPGTYYDALRNGTYAASHGTDKLRALVKLVYRLRNGIDAILITGDIATTGLDFDLLPSSSILEWLRMRYESNTVEHCSERPKNFEVNVPEVESRPGP